MLTAIQFIGLIVTTFIGSPTVTGVNNIIGNFTPNTPHVRIIAYERGKGTKDPNWPAGPSFTGCGNIPYDSVLLTVSNVSISLPDPWSNQLSSMPHLTGCCNTFNAISPAWGNPNQANGRQSAFVTFSNGTYTSYKTKTGAVATVLFSNTTNPITFTATNPGGKNPMTLKVQPGAAVIVANEILSVLQCQPTSMRSGPPDFVQYYKMQANPNPNAACTGLPGNPPPNPCAPGLTSQPTTPPVAPGTPSQPGTASPQLTAAQQQWIKNQQGSGNTIDINCSSSQWP